MVMEKEKRAKEKREEREEVGRRQGAGRVTAKQAITRLVGRRMLVKVKADEKRVGESAVLGGEEWGGGGSKDEGAPSPMRRFAQGGVSSLRSSPRIEPCRIHGRARLAPPPPPPLLFTRIEIAFSNLRNSSPRNFYDLFFSLSLASFLRIPTSGTQPLQTRSEREREILLSLQCEISFSTEKLRIMIPCNVKHCF